MQIAIIAEIAPAKSFIPILKKIDADIIGLTHGGGVDELLGEYCTELYNIGKSRGKSAKKRSNTKIASLVLSDIWSVIKSLSGKKIDLLMTCGNAGDVRKGIAASKFLRIPTLHVEQDIYNPIEMIAFSNIITVPSKHYANFVTQNYGLKNVKVIEGYPMASYVSEIQLKDVNEIKNEFNMDDFLLLVFGGDVKGEEIPDIIKTVEKLERNVLIAPFRFNSEYVKKIVKSEKLKVLDGFVDLLSLMKASSGVIYGAGMGITIEAGVLGVPALKLAGFHRKHASVDLAEKLGIPIVEIEEIPDVIHNLKAPKGDWLVSNGQKAVSNVVSIVNDFENQKGKSSGFGSFRKIWNARSEFR